jgi:hypothetical protein
VPALFQASELSSAAPSSTSKISIRSDGSSSLRNTASVVAHDTGADEDDIRICGATLIHGCLPSKCETVWMFRWSMIFSENRVPPRIKSGAGFFGIML